MPDLITVQEAADLLDVSTTTVHRKIEAGELTPAAKLPGIRGPFLLNRADVERLAAA
jgi:excisionase family DNA binding protein